MRLFTWHLSGTVQVGTSQQETYRLDRDYPGPVRAWVHLDRAPTGDAPLIIDINVNGSSIFTLRPTIQTQETDLVEDTPQAFTAVAFSKDGLLTLDVDQVGSKESGRGMTVGLELETDANEA